MAEKWTLAQQTAIETLDKKHNNIIIGDIEQAEVVFTAHYDTPATSIIPNLMMPLNKILLYTYHFGFFIILAIVCMIIAKAISMLLTNQYIEWVIIYLILYFSSFIFLMRFFTNKNNFQCKKLIIATGGKSYSATGSSGDGYKFAKKFGHEIVPLRPALCGFKTLNIDDNNTITVVTGDMGTQEFLYNGEIWIEK